MIYAQHNFSENFSNASGRNDRFMMEQIVVDELSRAIVTNKRDVVELLRNHGINASFNDPYQRITHLALMLSSQNDMFNKDLAFLINKSHSADGIYQNLDGRIITDSTVTQDLQDTLKMVSKKNSKVDKNRVLDRVNIAESKMAEGTKKPMNKFLKWGLIGTATVVVVLAVALMIKKLSQPNAELQPLIPMSGDESTSSYSDNSNE